MIYSLFPVKSTTHFGLAIGLLLSILFGIWTYAIPPDSSARKPLEYPRVRNSNAQASPHDGILNKNYQYLYQEYIRNHFQFGLRITDYNFDRLYESSRDDIYFIGSNDSIQAENPGYGLHNFVFTWFPLSDAEERIQPRYQPLFSVIDGLGIELSWDHLRAKIVTSATAGRPAYSDGTIIAKGPMLAYVLHMHNPTRVTPYLGLGSIFYTDLSVTEGWWHYGFGSEAEYEDWVASGAEGDPTGGWRRTFELDKEYGTCMYLGATIRVYGSWLLDVFYRKTKVVFDNTYRISSRGSGVEERHSKWDLSNKTYGIGIRYEF